MSQSLTGLALSLLYALHQKGGTMKLQKWLWFSSGLMAGLTILSITRASIVKKGSVMSQVMNDTAIYQKLSEIRVAKEGPLDFDADIRHLSQLEDQYFERLLPNRATPEVRVTPQKRPMPVAKAVVHHATASHSGRTKSVSKWKVAHVRAARQRMVEID